MAAKESAKVIGGKEAPVYSIKRGDKITVAILDLPDGRSVEIRAGFTSGIAPTAWVRWIKNETGRSG